MSPEQLREFNKMKQDLENIKRCTDLSFVAELSRRLSGIQVRLEDGASTTGLEQLAGNVANDNSVACAADYQGAVNLYLNGTLIGRIGYYT